MWACSVSHGMFFVVSETEESKLLSERSGSLESLSGGWSRGVQMLIYPGPKTSLPSSILERSSSSMEDTSEGTPMEQSGEG